jgi:uncharacterized membrane protein YoaK (UPF0700 family)
MKQVEHTEQIAQPKQQNPQTVRLRAESFLIGSILALVGGFLDGYTYVSRGKVFANAQTGNMVLLGLRISEGHFSDALRYLLPILAFAAGVLLAEWIKSRYQGSRAFHWRQLVLGIEIVLLFGIGFVPDGKLNPYVNIAISLVCALQVESFRTLHELTYSTTMCTGNLRSGTEQLFRYFQTRERSFLQNSLHYFGIILVFIAGAVFGMVSTKLLFERAIWVPGALLALTLLLLRADRIPDTIDDICIEGSMKE